MRGSGPTFHMDDLFKYSLCLFQHSRSPKLYPGEAVECAFKQASSWVMKTASGLALVSYCVPQFTGTEMEITSLSQRIVVQVADARYVPEYT